MNKYERLVREHATTPAARNAIARLDALKRSLEQKKQQDNASDEFLNKLRWEGIEAIRADARRELAAGRIAIGEDLAHERSRWASERELDRSRVSYRLIMAERRFNAMADDELQEAATQYADGSEMDYDSLEVLSGILRERGLNEEQATVRKMMKARGDHEPWLKTERAERLKLADRLHRPEDPNAIPFAVDGNVAAFDVADLWGESDDE